MLHRSKNTEVERRPLRHADLLDPPPKSGSRAMSERRGLAIERHSFVDDKRPLSRVWAQEGELTR